MKKDQQEGEKADRVQLGTIKTGWLLQLAVGQAVSPPGDWGNGESSGFLAF
jgi:hypothetical protein